MANPNRRGPRVLSEILGELFTARGYGRLRAAGELEEAWNTAVGEPHCHQTRVGEVRHGVLTVTWPIRRSWKSWRRSASRNCCRP